MHNPINGLAAYCERKKEKKVKGITLPAIAKVSRETRVSEAHVPSGNHESFGTYKSQGPTEPTGLL